MSEHTKEPAPEIKSWTVLKFDNGAVTIFDDGGIIVSEEALRRAGDCYHALAGYNPEAVREVVSALRYIGHSAKDESYMKTARTLHYDMAHVANEALAKLDGEG